MKRSLLLTIAVSATVLVAPHAAAASISVTTTKDVLNNADHKCSLREAITVANTNTALGATSGECPAGSLEDEIKLAAGATYKLKLDGVEENANASGDLDVDLGGGFDNFVRIVGNAGTKVQQTVHHRVFDVHSGSLGLVGIIVTGGHAPDGLPTAGLENGEAGGGIRNFAHVGLTLATVSGNRAGDGAVSPGLTGVAGSGGHGGGIFSASGLNLHRSKVSGNTAGNGALAPTGSVNNVGGAGGGGGGISVSNGGVVGQKTKIVDNAAGIGGSAAPSAPATNAGPGGQGGGLEITGGADHDLHRMTIMRNRGGKGGDGATNTGAGAATAGGNGGAGGGLAHTGGNTSLTFSTVASNVTGDGGTGGAGGTNPAGAIGGSPGAGGGVMSSASSLFIFGTTISRNHLGISGVGGTGTPPGSPGPNSPGAGIQTGSGATLNLRNSTVSGNSGASVGGGIQSNGTTILNNATIASNSADQAGGIARAAGSVDVDNSIIANNSATTAPDCQGTFLGGDYDLVEDLSGGCNGFGGTDVLAVDPKLGPLDRNGGPTATHALRPGSPAINAGDPDEPDDDVINCENVDQRGKLRPSPPKRCDIGAFEKL